MSGPLSMAAAVLPTGVLDAPAAKPSPAVTRAALAPPSDPERRFLPYTGDEPRPARQGKTAPAPKTGVGATRPDVAAQTAKETSDFYLGLAQKGVSILGDSVTRMLSAEKGEEKELAKVLGDAFLSVAKSEASAVVGTLPYAKAITTAITLSAVFADAAGKAIAAAGARLNYDDAVSKVLSASEIGEQEMRALRFIRAWQRNSAAEVEGVIREGLAAVAEKLIDDLFARVEGALSQSLKSVAGQLAKQLFKHNEILAIINDLATDQAKQIPAMRARMERIAFHGLANTWVKLLGDKVMQAKLAPLVGGLGGKEPVHVALLGGMLEVILSGSYEEYAKRVPVNAARDELRSVLVGAAQQLVRTATAQNVKVESGDTLTLSEARVVVPASLFNEVTGKPLPPNARNLYFQRADEFNVATRRLSVVHQGTRRRFQEEIYRADERQQANPRSKPDPMELYRVRRGALVKLREDAMKQLKAFTAEVERVFGSRYENHATKLYFVDDDRIFGNLHFPVELAMYRGDSPR